MGVREEEHGRRVLGLMNIVLAGVHEQGDGETPPVLAFLPTPRPLVKGTVHAIRARTVSLQRAACSGSASTSNLLKRFNVKMSLSR